MRRAAWWAGLVIFVSVAAYGYSVVQRMKDRGEVAKMTAKMQTVCVGRFLIDLPADAGHYINGAFVGGFRVSWAEESREQFAARLVARESEISAVKSPLGRKNLESVNAIDANGFTGKIFTFGRSSTHTLDGDVPQVWEAVKLEGYVNSNGKSFNFIADGYDPAKIGILVQLIGQLREVPPGSIPTAPGFCFGPGMLIDPVTAAMAEKIVLFAGLPGHPDIAIAFNTMAGLKQTSPGLLERRAKAAADQPPWVRARFSTLRSGGRTVNGLTGEEAVMKVTEKNFSLVYGFDWELAGSEDDVLVPAIHLEMSSGNNPRPGGEPVRSSLSQHALLELWDKIVSSVRVRPTAAPMASDVLDSAVSPIGTVAFAGEVCPQSGWWLCNAEGAGVQVHGGQRQYIRQGQRMPQALLLPPQTFWEKVRGVQSSFESKTPTAWKLVDKRSRERIAPPMPLDRARVPAPAAIMDTADPSAVEQPSIGTYVTTG
ncbi:MAG TPA: T6SS immunity protein Tli4 family protein, partial [Terriglobales bacterium]|nr:T6SS immunity protein Tli4 family protein [Terriglobales bacterium]